MVTSFSWSFFFKELKNESLENPLITNARVAWLRTNYYRSKILQAFYDISTLIYLKS
jgi:hypothetical protein